MDLIIGTWLLLMALPLMLLTAAVIKLTSRGPVIFRQKRVGRGGRIFTMYKFRSMQQGAEDIRPLVQDLNEKDGPVFKIRDDPRLTPTGRFVRRSSIDELPQLINVLRGEMSLVGPRPMLVDEARQDHRMARVRTAVKPGLTCLWQISGRCELSYEDWLRLDLYYLRNRGLLLDLMILVQTVPAVISGHGAY